MTDTDGITHIYGKNDADTFYGAGYAMAKDRLFQMEVSRRRASGRLSELFGKQRRKDDIGARAFNFIELGRRDYELLKQERPGDAALLDAWTAGINARIEEVRSGKAPRPYGLGPDELNFVPDPWEPFHGTAVGKTLTFPASPAPSSPSCWRRRCTASPRTSPAGCRSCSPPTTCIQYPITMGAWDLGHRRLRLTCLMATEGFGKAIRDQG